MRVRIKAYTNIILFTFFTFITITSVHANATVFNITTKDTTTQLGKPVWLDLQTDQTSPSLDSIDFTAVTDQFEVVKDKNEIRNGKQGQQWRIRLYPREEGQHTITPLHYQSHATAPITIQVTPPVDLKTGQPFSIKHQVSSTQVWLRQQVLVTYELTTPETTLVLAPQEATLTDVSVMPLTTATTHEQNTLHHRSGWALYPRKPGPHRIQLPALNYIQDGVITHHFYPPAIDLEIKPLPAYLPGNLPVGRLSLHANDVPRLLLNKHLSEVHLQLRGEGIPLPWLPDLRALFRASTDITLYPAALATQQTRSGGIVSQHDYHLPIKTNAQGRLVLPDVKLHYFDPTTGRLALLTLPDRAVLSLSLWFVVMLVLIAIAAVAWAGTKTFAWLLPKWRCFKAYRDALKVLPEMKTAQDFREWIRRLSEAEGQSPNQSLRQWRAGLPSRKAELAEQVIHHIEPALYHAEGCNIGQAQEVVREFCLNTWRVLRWGG